jgi:hypothetical protein
MTGKVFTKFTLQFDSKFSKSMALVSNIM